MKLGDIRALPYPDDTEVFVNVQGMGWIPSDMVPWIDAGATNSSRWATPGETNGSGENLWLIVLPAEGELSEEDR